MKKILCLVLAFAMALSLAACGGNTEPETPDVPAFELTGTLKEIADKIYANETVTDEMAIETKDMILEDIDGLTYNLGVASADAIESAVLSEPMMSSIAYSLALVKAKEGADIEALKNEILEGVNYRKWICVAAEKVAVVNCGNVIMMIMSSEEIVDGILNAFSTVCEGNVSEVLTKAGEVQEDLPFGEPIEEDMPAAMPGEDMHLGDPITLE
ncbi:MAG: hypothetical protein IJB16_01435 [Clostridia bacterium]|nr:hypothetical protein [Clostridia bacterium]